MQLVTETRVQATMRLVGFPSQKWKGINKYSIRINNENEKISLSQKCAFDDMPF